MRFLRPLLLAALMALLVAGAAYPSRSMRPAQPASIGSLRVLVDHYRTLTWTYERAAHVPRTQSSFSDRRSRSRTYLLWAVDTWTRRARAARARAIVALDRRLAVHLPAAPPRHARIAGRIRYNRTLALRLRGIYPGGRATREFASAHAGTPGETLRLWQARSARAALIVARHAQTEPPHWLRHAFLCIHRYEAAWNANTGNGYYGGLQMDVGFQARYGHDFLRRWGTADRWPVWAQLQTAFRAHRSGRGFWPWPNTARACGLL